MHPTLTLRLRDRLDALSTQIVSGIEYTFDCYERPFAEGRVIGPKGETVADISPRLRQAQARVMKAAAAFERIAGKELAALTAADEARERASYAAYARAGYDADERRTK